MKLQQYIDWIKSREDILSALDRKYEGACPCFWHKKKVDGKYIQVRGHCWRTTVNAMVDGCSCQYSGIHLRGDFTRAELMRVGKAIKQQLDELGWTHWSIRIDKSSDELRGSENG